MKMLMRCFGVLACLTLVFPACSDYTGTLNEWKAPVLSKDWKNVVELKGNVNFGDEKSDSFSTQKALTGFVFDSHQGARVTITLKATNGDDPVLLVYGPLDNKGIWGGDGKHIALDHDGKDGRNSLIADLVLSKDGRYLIGADTRDGSEGGPFQLTVGCRGECDEPRCDDETLLCDLYCPGGFMTDPAGCPICRCVEECRTDEDCLLPWSDQIARCIDGQCVYEEMACDSDMGCPEGFVCEVMCVGGGIACPDNDPNCFPDDTCDPATGQCFEECFGRCVPVEPVCQSDADCPAGQVCLLECWGGVTTCDSGDPNCLPDDCDPATGDCMPSCEGRCVPQAIECGADGACPPGYVCEMTCWDCDPNFPDCTGGCEGHCVPEPMPGCDENIPCPEGFECVMECWQAGCDATTGECPQGCDPSTGEQCGPVCRGYCVPRQDECRVDEDCLAAGVIGRCIDGRCVFDEIRCDDTTGATCPPGMECVMMCWDCVPDDPNCFPGCEGYCVPVEPGCRVDTDCISPDGQIGRCVEGRCVFDTLYCHADFECPPGFACEFIECIPGCEGGPSGRGCCQGVCVPVGPECRTDEECVLASSDGTALQGRCIDGRCVFDDCNCYEIYAPVCAEKCPDCVNSNPPCAAPCELRTYPNDCYARCDGAFIVHPGTCDDPPPYCGSDRDCPPGMYCELDNSDPTTGGICMPLPNLECLDDADCPQGFRCEQFYCPDMPCTPDGNCPPCGGQCVPDQGECIITGCSGEVCAPFPVNTTCTWLPEYACLRLTTCELLTSQNGARTCGWVQTPEYLECLQNIHNAGECRSDIDCPPGTLCQTFCGNGWCESRCYEMDCVCPDYQDPVCGPDGSTYENVCNAICAGVSAAPCGDDNRP